MQAMRRTAMFADRRAAGEELALAVARRRLSRPLLVLGLPRGGIPVAAPIAQRLDAPLDALVVRKIGLPGQPELAIGAIGPGEVAVRTEIVSSGLVDEATFRKLAERERVELRRRERTYRDGLPPLVMQDRHLILVDDGLATGASMLAAVAAAHAAGAASVMVAAPVASVEARQLLDAVVDELVLLLVPHQLTSIGEFYAEFGQVSDGEVLRLLDRMPAPMGLTGHGENQ